MEWRGIKPVSQRSGTGDCMPEALKSNESKFYIKIQVVSYREDSNKDKLVKAV
jgi:hypothetical protein